MESASRSSLNPPGFDLTPAPGGELPEARSAAAVRQPASPAAGSAAPTAGPGGIWRTADPALPRWDAAVVHDEILAEPAEECILVLPDGADAAMAPVFTPADPLAFPPQPVSDQADDEVERPRASAAGKPRDNVIAMPSPSKSAASGGKTRMSSGEGQSSESRLSAIRLNPPLAHRLEAGDFPCAPALAPKAIEFMHRGTGNAPAYRASGS
jgi:hypothetical protein